MRIKSPRVKSHRGFKVNDTLPAEARERLRRLELFQTLRGEGCSEATALAAIGWARATLYRWRKRYRRDGPSGLCAKSRRPHHVSLPRWSAAEERKVWALRRDFPFMGKRKLRVLPLREGIDLSESTVGRILAKGVRLGRIEPCAFCRGRVKVKQPRRFHGHARRLSKGEKPERPGELVQIDHLSASRDSKQLKEFKAVSPVGKQMVVQVSGRATARNAKRFLETVRAQLPFPLVSAQVDGGSEFRADFEQACEDLKIPLFVLPPKRPQPDGCVERANDTTRVEFWNRYDGDFTVEAANRALDDYRRFYHQVRPHQALDFMTPDEYLRKNKDSPSQSHMC